MAKKLYVGGLNYDTNEDGLREAFAKAGTVESATIIMDRVSGRSKGFGFIEMSSDEEASARSKSCCHVAMPSESMKPRTRLCNK